ncbi:hypothetical protein GLW08_10395 [Pontibacillus yanchengensis]|uniref:Uncharacterized protein n=1 Tax=Pontibacillus yanchengensis TaxID=462910 RepID=A0ACC7VGL5_9BACI|nr:DnaA N-terminal domain-containing protein [Pontibacillus yanchengensis]MYL53745.1 hypothetical protein [Pontibacillus yanchengensis]
MNSKELWDEVLKMMKEEVPRASFKTWLDNTEATIQNDVLIVTARDGFSADWLKVRFKDLISEKVKEITNQDYTIEIKCEGNTSYYEETFKHLIDSSLRDTNDGEKKKSNEEHINRLYELIEEQQLDIRLLKRLVLELMSK